MDKKTLIRLEISIGIIVILLLLVFILSFIIQKPIDKKISQQIQEVLTNYSPDTYIIGDKISLNNQITTIGKFYLVSNEVLDEDAYVVTIRIMGLSGPVTAIFLYENKFTTFIDFLGFKNIREYNNHGVNQSQLAYWNQKINEVASELLPTKEGEINE